MSANPIEISVIAPTFNEAENIQKLYQLLNQTLHDFRWELIVVDDNSPDETWKIARTFATEVDNLKVIRRVKTRGLSSACIEGVQLASGEYSVVMDADLQHDERVIPKMIEQLRDGHDLVIASRFAENGSASGLANGSRLLISNIGNAVSRLIMKHRLSDPLTGFFALRTEDFLLLTPKLSDSGFKILVDLLIVGNFVKVTEVGFEFRSRQAGSSKLDHVIIWQFMAFIIEKLSYGLLPARFISFALVGGSGVLVHFITLFTVLQWTEAFWIGQLAATLIAMTSNFFFNNWLTFFDQRLHGWSLVRGFILFSLFASVGILANVGMANYLAHQMSGADPLSDLTIVVAALAGIFIDTLWKFVMSQRFVWRQS